MSSPTLEITLNAVVITPTSVGLDWTDSLGTANYYQVIRNSIQVAVLPSTQTSWVDDTATPNTVFDYEVNGLNNVYTVVYFSNTVEVTTPQSYVPQIEINWNEGSLTAMPANVVGYEILRSSQSGNSSPTPYVYVGQTDGNTLTFIDSTVALNTQYFYRIAGFGIGQGVKGYSAPSAATAGVYANTTPPNPPVLVSVVSSLPGNAVLVWTDGGAGTYPETTYNIYRSTDNINFNQIGYVLVPALTYTDTTLLTNVTYYYQITAADIYETESSPSNTISTEIITFPTSTDLLSLYSGLVSGNGAFWDIVTAGQGALYTTTNAATLVAQTSGSAANLWGVTEGFSHNVVVGDSGTILTSTNSTSWTANDHGTNNLYGVGFLPLSTSPGTQVMIAVGAGGTILATQTPTSSWTANTSGVSVDLRSITYLPISTHQSYMYIAGANGTILAVGPTNASGLTYSWAQQSTPTSQQLNGIAAGNLGVGVVAVGNNGTILHSNGANSTSWFLQTSGTTKNLHGVTWDGNNSVFVAVGDDGTELKSTNGTSWTTVTPITSNNLYGIYNNSTNAIGSPAFATIAVGQNEQFVTSAQPATVTIISGINSGNGPLIDGEMAGFSDGAVSGGPPNYNNGSSVGGVPTTQFLFGYQVQALCFEDTGGQFKTEVIVYGSHPQNLFNTMSFTSVASGLLETFVSSGASYAVITGTHGTFTYWQWNAISHYPFGFSGTHVITFT